MGSGVGSYNDNGIVRIFKRTDEQWEEIDMLPFRLSYTAAIFSVAISGKYAVAGTPCWVPWKPEESGQVFVFNINEKGTKFSRIDSPDGGRLLDHRST